MTVVEAFEGRPWLRLWCHAWLHCAAYANPLGFAVNGYVLIPADSPLLVVSEAHDIVRQAQSRFPMSVGYDGLIDLIDSVHGGLTYGPDAQGWVGFDTAHAWDHWDQPLLALELEDATDYEALAHAAEMAQKLGDMWPPTVNDPRFNRYWTMDLLIDETNHVANTVADADQALRQVRKILERT